MHENTVHVYHPIITIVTNDNPISQGHQSIESRFKSTVLYTFSLVTLRTQ